MERIPASLVAALLLAHAVPTPSIHRSFVGDVIFRSTVGVESAGFCCPSANDDRLEAVGSRFVHSDSGRRIARGAQAIGGASVPGPLTPSAHLLTMPATLVGSDSAAVPLDLLNTTNAVVTIENLTLQGDFTETDNCLPVVQPGAHCLINVTFSPVSAGKEAGSLSISFQGGSSLTILLAGTALPKVATLDAPQSVAFAPTPLGSTATKTITISNTTGVAVGLSRIATDGGFAVVAACPNGLIPAYGKCDLALAFTPTAPGPLAGLLSLDSSGGTIATVSLTGVGLAGQLEVSPAELAFPLTMVGEPSKPKGMTISNTGLAPLGSVGVFVTGDFASSNNCPAALLPGRNCGIEVVAIPTSPGVHRGSIVFKAGGQLSLESLAVTGAPESIGSGARGGGKGLSVGAGLALAVPLIAPHLPRRDGGPTRPDFVVSTYRFEFQRDAVGIKEAKPVTITNLTQDPLALTLVPVGRVSISGCDQPIAGGASCVFVIGARQGPGTPGPGAVVISDDHGYTVSVGVRTAAPVLKRAPPSICAAFDLARCGSIPSFSVLRPIVVSVSGPVE